MRWGRTGSELKFVGDLWPLNLACHGRAQRVEWNQRDANRTRFRVFERNSKILSFEVTPSKQESPSNVVSFSLRGHNVLLDASLAALYGVPTKRLNEQVRRNIRRFPEDFMFRLSVNETLSLRSQNQAVS